ncbi:eukaryotic translation initiation factor 3 subunit K-like [Ornithodoros turicata]
MAFLPTSYMSDPLGLHSPDVMRTQVAQMLKGIDRYNPENLATLEKYVNLQATENFYDLEANLAVLKLYQFNPDSFQKDVVVKILLKALTNLPHTDFVLCKCLIDQDRLSEPDILLAMTLHSLLESCDFQQFWNIFSMRSSFHQSIKGFRDSIRKFVCYVISMTYQNIFKALLCDFLDLNDGPELQGWIASYGWKDMGNGYVFVCNQEEIVKTKNITEKIDFESVEAIMASCR